MAEWFEGEWFDGDWFVGEWMSGEGDGAAIPGVMAANLTGSGTLAAEIGFVAITPTPSDPGGGGGGGGWGGDGFEEERRRQIADEDEIILAAIYAMVHATQEAEEWEPSLIA